MLLKNELPMSSLKPQRPRAPTSLDENFHGKRVAFGGSVTPIFNVSALETQRSQYSAEKTERTQRAGHRSPTPFGEEGNRGLFVENKEGL